VIARGRLRQVLRQPRQLLDPAERHGADLAVDGAAREARLQRRLERPGGGRGARHAVGAERQHRRLGGPTLERRVAAADVDRDPLGHLPGDGRWHRGEGNQAREQDDVWRHRSYVREIGAYCPAPPAC